MGNSTNTIQLIKTDVFDINKQKVNVDLGFAIKEEINLMKKNGKIKETKVMEAVKRLFTRLLKSSWPLYVTIFLQKRLFNISLLGVAGV